MKRCCPQFLPENAPDSAWNSEATKAERKAVAGDDWISEEEFREAAIKSVDALEDPDLRRVLHLRFGLDRVEPDESGKMPLPQLDQHRTPLEVANALGGKYKGNAEAGLTLIRRALRAIPLVVDDPKDLKILHEDDDLLIVSKPAQLRCTPVHRFVGKSLTNQVLGHAVRCLEAEADRTNLDDEARQKLRKELVAPALVHRLDQSTSGVVVCAKSAKVASFLQEQWHTDAIQKEYLALAAPSSSQFMVEVGMEWVVDVPISKDPDPENPTKRYVSTTDGLPAATRFKVLATTPKESEVQMVLLFCVLQDHGRTHQIRLHASHENLPLIGDTMYGGQAQAPEGAPLFPKRVALHAWRLTLPHPKTKETMVIEAPLADDIRSCAEGFGLPVEPEQWPQV